MGDRAGSRLHSPDFTLWSNVFKLGAMAAVALDIECNLQLCAATAVEDRLQDNVSDTLVSLMEADMKVDEIFESKTAICASLYSVFLPTVTWHGRFGC
jgi:hypothetical protein